MRFLTRKLWIRRLKLFERKIRMERMKTTGLMDLT
jgi:hypothetical protein